MILTLEIENDQFKLKIEIENAAKPTINQSIHFDSFQYLSFFYEYPYNGKINIREKPTEGKI